MTTQPEDITVSGKDLGLIGQILTANVKWSQDISNRVEQNLQQEVLEWKSAFLALFDSVCDAQEHARSMDIEQVIRTFNTKAYYAEQPSYFEENFRKGF